MGLRKKKTKRREYSYETESGQRVFVPEGMTTVEVRDDSEITKDNERGKEVGNAVRNLADLSFVNVEIPEGSNFRRSKIREDLNSVYPPKMENAKISDSSAPVDMHETRMEKAETPKPRIVVNPDNLEDRKHYRQVPLKGWRRFLRFQALIPGMINIPVPVVSPTGKHHGWREVSPHVSRKTESEQERLEQTERQSRVAASMGELGATTLPFVG